MIQLIVTAQEGVPTGITINSSEKYTMNEVGALAQTVMYKALDISMAMMYNLTQKGTDPMKIIAAFSNGVTTANAELRAIVEKQYAEHVINMEQKKIMQQAQTAKAMEEQNTIETENTVIEEEKPVKKKKIKKRKKSKKADKQ